MTRACKEKWRKLVVSWKYLPAITKYSVQKEYEAVIGCFVLFIIQLQLCRARGE